MCNKVADGSITLFIGKLGHPRNPTQVSCALISYPFYSSCSPEPHILLFRRPLGTDPQSGRVDPELLKAAREEYKDQFGLRK